MANEWFYDWFNSPYYHLLYHKRNYAEAEYFINNLCARLNPHLNSSFLDIACGRGRFALYLNKHGHNVTGIDLSIESIRYAKRFENDSLHFFIQNMRQRAYSNECAMAFNMFTTSGYFKADEEHVHSLVNFKKALKPGGLLVLDFFNSHKVIQNLIAEDVKNVNGIDFHIQKMISGNQIIKTIAFADKGKSYTFNEIVRLFTVDDFKRFFEQSGFEIMTNFGSYGLDDFDIEHSDRLIFICKRSDA